MLSPDEEETIRNHACKIYESAWSVYQISKNIESAWAQQRLVGPEMPESIALIYVRIIGSALNTLDRQRNLYLTPTNSHQQRGQNFYSNTCCLYFSKLDEDEPAEALPSPDEFAKLVKECDLQSVGGFHLTPQPFYYPDNKSLLLDPFVTPTWSKRLRIQAAVQHANDNERVC